MHPRDLPRFLRMHDALEILNNALPEKVLQNVTENLKIVSLRL